MTGVKAHGVGIGGGTCAGFFRKRGFAAAVWSRHDDTEHRPDEYAIIENIVCDAKVFAHLFVWRA